VDEILLCLISYILANIISVHLKELDAIGSNSNHSIFNFLFSNSSMADARTLVIGIKSAIDY
jgi:hypothetical protein